MAGEALGLATLYARRRVSLPIVVAAGALSMVLSFDTWDLVQDGRPHVGLLLAAAVLIVTPVARRLEHLDVCGAARRQVRERGQRLTAVP